MLLSYFTVTNERVVVVKKKTVRGINMGDMATKSTVEEAPD
jgi:hypothetical protein